MKNIFANSLLLLLSIGMLKAEADCDYQVYLEGWFKLHDVPMTWREARLTCQYEGAQLASPTAELIDTMTQIISKRIPSGKVFTGIHATFASRHFSTIEGVPLSRIPHKWVEDELDNIKISGDCISLDQNGTVTEFNCEAKLSFICYKGFEKGFSLNECGTADDEYVLDNRTGSCYKFHRYPHSWARAYMICEAEGGYLAIINSEKEAEVMKDILARNPENSLPPAPYRGGAHIGFRDVDEHGRWITIQGQTLKEAGYDKFDQGQPDNRNQNCGNVFRSGLLDDAHCEDLIPFICEKDPSRMVFYRNY